MKVQVILASLEPGRAARQATLLARYLPETVDLRVCVLGGSGFGEEELRERASRGNKPDDTSGCLVLNWKRLFDFRPLWTLRQALRDERPDLVHVWGPACLRWSRLLGERKTPPRFVVSCPLLGRSSLAQVGPLERRLLRSADAVIAGGPAEAARCRKLGVPLDALATIPPGVEVVQPESISRAAFLKEQRLPAESKVVFFLGPFEPGKGCLEALWAFDIIRYARNDVHLFLLGGGSEFERMRQFVRSMGSMSHVHFLGPRSDVARLLPAADVVWVPSREPAGLNAALEAMSASRAVLATRLPDLAELIIDGSTGVLIAPGDKVAWARQTCALLVDDHRRSLLGEAAQQRVRSHFAADDVARRVAELYELLLRRSG
ncbi:MAG: glycosyltransferase [Gemmataceae bacterium]